MKKTLANIRILAALLIASAAFTACTSEDSAIIDNAQPAAQQAPQVYTLTIQAGKDDGALTRALTLETNGDITASWENDDVVTVTKGTTSLGTLTASNASGKTCTFSGTLTGSIAVNDVLTLTYHPMASLSAFGSQNGQLVSAAACDMAEATVTVASESSGVITIKETSAKFETKTAMLKITLQDTGGHDLGPSSLTISAGGTEIFTLTSIVHVGTLYLAMPSAATVAAATDMTTDALAAATITFTAKVGDDTYVATKTGYPFAAGKYYTTTLTMARTLAGATTADHGKVVCADGHLHDAKTAVPTGCTAVGILGKVTTTGHGLILALKDANRQNWSTINDWASVETYASTTLQVLPDGARGANLTSYTTLGSTAVSNWAVAQKSDYEAIFINLGSTTGNDNGKTYDGNVNAYITIGVGGTEISGNYWSATESSSDGARAFASDYWFSLGKSYSGEVRPVLGF